MPLLQDQGLQAQPFPTAHLPIPGIPHQLLGAPQMTGYVEPLALCRHQHVAERGTFDPEGDSVDPSAIARLERFAFYDRARTTFVIVQTGERRPQTMPGGGCGCSCGNWMETSVGFMPKPRPY